MRYKSPLLADQLSQFDTLALAKPKPKRQDTTMNRITLILKINYSCGTAQRELSMKPFVMWANETSRKI